MAVRAAFTLAMHVSTSRETATPLANGAGAGGTGSGASPERGGRSGEGEGEGPSGGVDGRRPLEVPGLLFILDSASSLLVAEVDGVFGGDEQSEAAAMSGWLGGLRVGKSLR